jgi:hypothetical protein
MALLYGNTSVASEPDAAEKRYMAWFHELDAWTEYWDVYHPETQGHYYFGNDSTEQGLLTHLLPRRAHPPAFMAWTRSALGLGPAATFAAEAQRSAVAQAVREVDALLDRIFSSHFGDPRDPEVRGDYLYATFRAAINTLPPARERDSQIADDDPRKPTAGRHMIDGDLMWFAWALVLEAAELGGGSEESRARRALMMAGVAAGCPANFVWRGHRRTRPEYQPDDATQALLHARGLAWADDFPAAAEEVHALYRFREWGYA